MMLFGAASERGGRGRGREWDIVSSSKRLDSVYFLSRQ